MSEYIIYPTIEEVEERVMNIMSEGLLDLESISERLPYSWQGSEVVRHAVAEVVDRLTNPRIEQVEEIVRQALSEGPLDLESISERFPDPWFGNEATIDDVGEVFERLAQDTLRGGRFGLRGTHP
jgi:hypothetical protein